MSKVLEALPPGALKRLAQALESWAQECPVDAAYVRQVKRDLTAVRKQNAAVKHAARLAQAAAQADPTPYH